MRIVCILKQLQLFEKSNTFFSRRENLSFFARSSRRHVGPQPRRDILAGEHLILFTYPQRTHNNRPRPLWARTNNSPLHSQRVSLFPHNWVMMGLPIVCTAAVTGLGMTRDDGRENTVLTNCTTPGTGSTNASLESCPKTWDHATSIINRW